ncbi:hypothetical protein H8959_021527 [Pygathrix nigripes]
MREKGRLSIPEASVCWEEPGPLISGRQPFSPAYHAVDGVCECKAQAVQPCAWRGPGTLCPLPRLRVHSASED